jgi:HD-GYP domain-containing protein (c-di-GMP phosphodiesterase class II)
MRIDRNQIQDIFISALLHDIGRFGLSPMIRSKAANELTPAEREQFKSHPARGAMVLMAVPELRLAGRVIRAHHERFDGMGYPDGLAGQDIPLGARILAVANDYDELQTGAMGEEYFEREQARDFIQEWSGRRYDPLVVEAFSALLSSGGLSLAGTDSLAIRELVLQPEQIEAGMVLSRDLISRDGLLLLAEEYVLDDEWIGMIREFARSQDPSLVIHVDANKTIHNPHAILSERS